MRWNATNESLSRLKALLETHEENLDPRFIEESEFHRQRRDHHMIFENDDSKVDFWSSTCFHRVTPRPQPVALSINTVYRHFQEQDIVVFKDSIDPTKFHTGRVIDSPYDTKLTVKRNEVTHEQRQGKVVRRGKQGGFYKVQLICKYIIAEYFQVEEELLRKNIILRHTSFASEQTVIGQKRHDGKKLRKPRFELLSIDEIESYEEYKKRKLQATVGKTLFFYLQKGVKTWKEFMQLSIQYESECQSARKIQKFWRITLVNRFSTEQQILTQMIQVQKDNEEERLRKDEQDRLDKIKFIREHGVTKDSVRFFLNEVEMELFYTRVQEMCEKLSHHKITDFKLQAIRVWRYYIQNVLPPTHLDFEGIKRDVKDWDGVVDSISTNQNEFGDLPQKLKLIANQQASIKRIEREELNWTKPWHPALNIRLPALPVIGCRLEASGGIKILDIKRYQLFKKNSSGPTDSTSWLFQGAYASILFGGYPNGQARVKSQGKITSRSSSIASILFSGVDTFVCLMTNEELSSMKSSLPFDQQADEMCDEFRTELSVGVRAAKSALDLAKERLERGKLIGYGKIQLDALERAETNRLQDYKRLKAQFDNFSPKLNHVYFPMPKNGALATETEDTMLLDFCNSLENRLRSKERIFIFSQGGSGRAGVVSAVLLGRMYGLQPHEALERVQRHHDTQGRYLCSTIPESCPKLIMQQQQVVRLLQHSDSKWDTTVVRALHEGTPVTLQEKRVRHRGTPINNRHN